MTSIESKLNLNIISSVGHTGVKEIILRIAEAACSRETRPDHSRKAKHHQTRHKLLGACTVCIDAQSRYQMANPPYPSQAHNLRITSPRYTSYSS